MSVLGVDPGSAHVGWALLDQGVYVAAGVLEDLSARAVVVAVRDILWTKARSPRVIAVERVDQVNARGGFGATMATGLLLGHGVGQRIVQAAEDDGVEVREVTAETWHMAYFNARAVDGAAVKALVTQRIPGWPKVSSPHARDAAAIALWAWETPPT